MKRSLSAIDFWRSAAMPPNASAASTVSTPHSSAASDSIGGVPQMKRDTPAAGR